MSKYALALACVVCVGHGWRARTLTQSDSSPSRESCENLKPIYTFTGLQTPSKVRGGGGSWNSRRAFWKLLQACSPATASFCPRCRHPCLQKRHSCSRHASIRCTASDLEKREVLPESEHDAKHMISQFEADRKLNWEREQMRRAEVKATLFWKTLQRVVLPTVLSALLGYFIFDEVASLIRAGLDDESVTSVFSDDAQFIQNCLNVDVLLFAVLADNAYSALYQQQKSIYEALYQEVSEAKSLFEQITLVCQNRPFYMEALFCLRRYIKKDLRCLDIRPAEMLSTKPMEDPLENIMYMTSVGVPSVVYETVKGLRQARGQRLAAMQRKFPIIGIGLLYVLAFILLLAFPILGATCAQKSGILQFQALLFACLTGGVELVLRIILELWSGPGGVFNVDGVLQRMIFGLNEELDMRTQQALLLNPGAAATLEALEREYEMMQDDRSVENK